MQKILIAILALGLSGVLAAAQPAGSVTSVAGKASVYSAAKPGAAAGLRTGQMLYAGDRLVTGANGRVALVLVDGTRLKVNVNTDITLQDKDSQGHASIRGIASIKLALGQLWAKVTKKDSRLEFATPSAVAAVKGTELILESDLDHLCAKLKEGRLDVSNDLGGVSLSQLQMVCVQKGQKPPQPQAWNGQDGWTSGVGGASEAEVEVRYEDGGQDKTLKLEYAK